MRRHRAFTMIEAAFSLVIVSVMLIAALNTVGTSQMMQHKLAYQGRALLLAEDLMTEILQASYEEPVDTPIEMGPETGETLRKHFDDVDDYEGWSASPPTDRGGVAIPETNGYTRTVTVQWVDPQDVITVEPTETGLKRVRVLVQFEGKSVVTLTGLRSEGVPDPVVTRDTWESDK